MEKKQLQILIEELIRFRDARDWQQFHNSKDLALALSIEASEVSELFLWKKSEEVDPDKLKHELADVLSYCLLIANNHDIDLETALLEKIAINEKKYPIDKAKGNAKKYTDF
ncbi:nucleotide pyrophosphohydrolase [Nibrella saemangeumensis]|uniref:Nucleotide pyrophosphohydrolase n=1 Tax=Nibrella saemangeumensis TaxID=1084526 RepID=A0ABP8N9S7_9BACT